MERLTQSQSLPDQEELEYLLVSNASDLTKINKSPIMQDWLTLTFGMGYDIKF